MWTNSSDVPSPGNKSGAAPKPCGSSACATWRWGRLDSIDQYALKQVSNNTVTKQQGFNCCLCGYRFRRYTMTVVNKVSFSWSTKCGTPLALKKILNWRRDRLGTGSQWFPWAQGTEGNSNWSPPETNGKRLTSGIGRRKRYITPSIICFEFVESEDMTFCTESILESDSNVSTHTCKAGTWQRIWDERRIEYNIMHFLNHHESLLSKKRCWPCSS